MSSVVPVVVFYVVESGIAHFLCACAYSKFGHHPHPYATLVPNLVSIAPHIAELARGEKLHTQSITQSLTHSLNQLT